MHIIYRRSLRQFWEKYPDSETALIRWFKLMNSNEEEYEEAIERLNDLIDEIGTN
jgi:mRNA interferase HigB